MNAFESIENLKKYAKEFLGKESCGHDFLHCLRVAHLAETIAQNDFPTANQKVVVAAAIVHDLCRPWERQTGRSHFCDEALGIISEKLISAGFSTVEKAAILDLVRWHDVYDPKGIPSLSLTVELKIHQDADRLDAIGAIGIARTFCFGGANNLPIYLPGERLVFDGYFVESPDHRTSTVAHFYEKLFKLRDQMHTPTGRKLANVRHQRMEQFMADFFEEWGEMSAV